MHHSPDPEASRHAVAIVGLACRFPGAADADQFWRNVKNGVESISFFTDDQLRRAGVDPALSGHPDYVRAKGVLDHIDMFDAAFFSVPPREAEIMDPQHRLFLECAWEALENAGCDPETHQGRIGVYAGIGTNSYYINHLSADPTLTDRVDPFLLLLCNQGEFVPTRASYKMNLTGPSLSLGTSCSTSLAAVHLAHQSLLNYQCDLALAGGVRIDLPQHRGYRYHAGGILSPDGHCRPFDATANGTVSGSGAGVVVLKRLAEALENQDHIYAVIRGGAMNNDGASKVGFAAPSVTGQTTVVAEALEMAGVGADTIGYVEAHGTATPMGDPIEVKALTQAFRISTDKRRFCAIGSVKANIGHLDAAAGMAAIIKTALILKHGMIPPTIHFREPNPGIDFENSPFYVQTRLREWDAHNIPRRAGVSAFGVGGTNVHLVLEQAPEPAPRRVQPDQSAHLLVLSAKSTLALDHACRNMARFLRENPDIPLPDIARTLSLGRSAFAFRRALVCENTRQAAEALKSPETLPVSRPYLCCDRKNPTTADQDLLESLAIQWLQGNHVDWTRLHPPGAHRLAPLPAYPFERQPYWIEAHGREHGMQTPHTGKNPDPAQWYYLPSWRRTLPATHLRQYASGPAAVPKTRLFLIDETNDIGPGEWLARRMHDQGDRIIIAHAGPRFEQTGPQTYMVPVQGEEGLQALFACLEQTYALPDDIVHLWTLTPPGKPPFAYEEIRNRGFYSLLHLARIISKNTPAGTDPATVTLITNGLEDVTGEEELMPDKSTLMGPAMVMGQEHPYIRCRILDIVPPAQEDQWESLMNRLAAVLRHGAPAPLAALRGNHFWTPYTDKILLNANPTVLPFKSAGVYLITGGMGAIGMHLAEFLARQYRARMVLIGRSLPNEATRLKLNELEATGARILTLQADVSNEDQMRDVMNLAHTRFGPVHGVIHAAGITGGKAYRTMTQTSPEECRAQFRPKVEGTRILARLLADEDPAPDFCLLFSSLSALLGGIGFAAYAAANRFLDAFAHQQNRRTRFPWISINWEGWQFPELRRTEPRHQIDKDLSAFALRPEEGLEALQRVLTSRAGHWAVSTGDLAARTARHRPGRHPSAAPAVHARPMLDTPYTAPENEIEERLTAVWRELFGIGQIGVHDDFFELGGDSVLAARAAARIQDEFGIDIPLPEMFERPTVSQQAEFVIEARISQLNGDEAEALFAQVNPSLNPGSTCRCTQDNE